MLFGVGILAGFGTTGTQPASGWIEAERRSLPPVPLYVPGELPLIRAEAMLNMNGATQSVVDEIDRVRTDSTGDDIPSPFGVAAELPPYSGPMTEGTSKPKFYVSAAPSSI